MLIALPVMCFPRTLKPQHAKKEYGHIPGQKASSFSKELKGKSFIYVQLNGPVNLFCCFTSQSTAMVMAGRSAHLATRFLGKLEQVS